MSNRNDNTADSVRSRLDQPLNHFSESPITPGKINTTNAMGKGSQYVIHKMREFLKPKVLNQIAGRPLLGFVMRVEPRHPAPHYHILTRTKQLPPNPTPDEDLPKLVAIKVRIPTLHAPLPKPTRLGYSDAQEASEDQFIMDMYPTFYSRIEECAIPGLGDVVRVSCSDWQDFTDPIYEELVSTSMEEVQAWAVSTGGSGEFKNSSKKSGSKLKGTMGDFSTEPMTSDLESSQGQEETIVTKWKTFKTPHPDIYGEIEVFVARGGPRDETGSKHEKSQYFSKKKGKSTVNGEKSSLIRVQSHTPLSFVQNKDAGWPPCRGGTKRDGTPIPIQKGGTNPFGTIRSGGMHTGEDVYVPPNTPVYAPFDLKVNKRYRVYSKNDGGAILEVQPIGFEHITLRLTHLKSGRKGTSNENIQLANKGQYKEGDLLGVTYYAGPGKKESGGYSDGCRTQKCAPDETKYAADEKKGSFTSRINCDKFPGNSDSHLHLELNVGGTYKKRKGYGPYGDLSPYEVIDVERMFVPRVGTHASFEGQSETLSGQTSGGY